jgi:DNA-binding XRE family transcriptional regulator
VARSWAGLTRERLAAEARISVRTLFALEMEGVRASNATQTVLLAALNNHGLALTREDLFPPPPDESA